MLFLAGSPSDGIAAALVVVVVGVVTCTVVVGLVLFLGVGGEGIARDGKTVISCFYTISDSKYSIAMKVKT